MDQHPRAITSPVPGLARLEWRFPNGCRPPEEPFGVCCAHINLATTHWYTKIIVPEGVVEGDSSFVNEKTGPGYARQNIPGWRATGLKISHVLGRRLRYNIKLPFRGLGLDTVGGRPAAVNA